MGQQLTDDLSRLLAGRKPDLMDKRGEFSVLVPLVEGDEGLSLLYEVRAKTMHSQPGEICFPGGRAEGNETPEECALRETWEELAIPPRSISWGGWTSSPTGRAFSCTPWRPRWTGRRWSICTQARTRWTRLFWSPWSIF